MCCKQAKRTLTAMLMFIMRMAVYKRRKPLVVETLGGWCQEAINIVKDIGRIQGHRLGISPSESTRHLFQRLSISLWKGNASLWIRRQLSVSPVVDGLI